MFTSIILLAHAVIPHHHHYNEICIFNPNSATEKQSDEHHNKTCSTQHKHDKSNDDESCILKKIVVFRSGAEQDLEVARFIDIHEDYYMAILPAGRIILSDSPEFGDFTHLPVSSMYSFFAPKSFGLRAPPLV